MTKNKNLYQVRHHRKQRAAILEGEIINLIRQRRNPVEDDIKSLFLFMYRNAKKLPRTHQIRIRQIIATKVFKPEVAATEESSQCIKNIHIPGTT